MEHRPIFHNLLGRGRLSKTRLYRYGLPDHHTEGCSCVHSCRVHDKCELGTSPSFLFLAMLTAQILQTLHEAVKNSQIQFATFQDYYQQIFDPVHFNPSPLWLSELLNGIATMMGIGAALTHQPEIEAGGVLAAGISNGIITYLTSISPTTTEVQTIAQLEK